MDVRHVETFLAYEIYRTAQFHFIFAFGVPRLIGEAFSPISIKTYDQFFSNYLVDSPQFDS